MLPLELVQTTEPLVQTAATAMVVSPIRYQRRAVKVRSATGPHRKRQRLAETPMATIEAAVATENPFCVRMNGSVMDAKPLLMPEGRSRKKKVKGAVDSGLRTVSEANSCQIATD